MRDLFAILAIILAVVSLGLFKVPNENALLESGLRAEARAALSQTRHPIDVVATGRVLTATGRVETEEARRDILSTLAALEGVEGVEDALTLLPEISPFVLTLTRSDAGVLSEGHSPDAALAQALMAPDLAVASGAPDGFDTVALMVAEILPDMLDGTAELRDQTVTLQGQVHLPEELQAIRAAMDSLPEGFSATVEVTALDDGRPYGMLVTRDPLLGLEVRGKVPPDFDAKALASLGAAQLMRLDYAPLPLDQPGFLQALDAALPVFAQIDEGSLTVAPDAVTLTGGPVAPEVIRAAREMVLPVGFARHLALVPEDDGAPLSLALAWDGAELHATGRVPRDFALPDITEQVTEDFARSPYPDLADWDAPLAAGVAALLRLDQGRLLLSGDGLEITGTAADPGARALARRALGEAGRLDADLQDDGRPAAFRLVYDAGAGGSVSGKLPADLTTDALAEALGIDALRGEPHIAPSGRGQAVLRDLTGLQPWLIYLDRLTVEATAEGHQIVAEVVPGLPVDTLRTAMRVVPRSVDLRAAAPPAAGTRRMHGVLDQPQIFTAGHWLPEQSIALNAEGCATAIADTADIPFAAGRFTLGVDAHWPLAALAAVVRGCTRFAGLSLEIEVEAASATIPELNGQVARRRADALRLALGARGVDAAAITAKGVAGASDQITYRWR
ncbi:hypothetical protein [Sagittula sp. SSi028]|uniref:hypothetical protein n=1 Tax=Sagittula sp. SSi028 TaxID=3400636 RepID=UPI003AF65549